MTLRWFPNRDNGVIGRQLVVFIVFIEGIPALLHIALLAKVRKFAALEKVHVRRTARVDVGAYAVEIDDRVV